MYDFKTYMLDKKILRKTNIVKTQFRAISVAICGNRLDFYIKCIQALFSNKKQPVAKEKYGLKRII